MVCFETVIQNLVRTSFFLFCGFKSKICHALDMQAENVEHVLGQLDPSQLSEKAHRQVSLWSKHSASRQEEVQVFLCCSFLAFMHKHLLVDKLLVCAVGLSLTEFKLMSVFRIH